VRCGGAVLAQGASKQIVAPRTVRPWLPLALLLLLASSGGLQADESRPLDLKEVARRVDRQYNSLQTLQADFEETYRGAGVARTESGVLWLRRPGKMRWEYRAPREKLFITNGNKALFHVQGEPHARQAKLEKIDDLRSPLRYLLGKTKLEKEFDDLRLLPAPPGGTASFILEGVPKMMRDRVERVRLEINPRYRIERITIEEMDGAITEFRFWNQVENGVIAEEKFRLKAPPGVQVIEGVEGTF
jgi:outer membrane lipoprotein carrier protein